MKNLIIKYRGWLVALIMAVAVSVIISPPQVREISKSRLQKLVKDREVASVTIVESRAGIRIKYVAEITLTSAASEKYSQLTAGISSSEESPHFVCSIGNSREEVSQWKTGLSERGRIDFSSDDFF